MMGALTALNELQKAQSISIITNAEKEALANAITIDVESKSSVNQTNNRNHAPPPFEQNPPVVVSKFDMATAQ